MVRYRWFAFAFGIVLVGVALSAAVVWTASASSGTDEACVAGASSIVAHVEDGRWVVEEPTTSGCTPTRSP